MSVRFDFFPLCRMWFGKCVAGVGILAIALMAGTAQAAIPTTERQVLQSFYQATLGDHWEKKDGWNGAPGTECSWHGIACNADQTHVTRIDLDLNNLRGYLPPSLPRLTRLTVFSVNFNELYGPLPQLDQFQVLQEFRVAGQPVGSPSQSHLSGSIPRLPASIETFDASENELTGEVPPLSALHDLRYFNVKSNMLSGPFPILSGLRKLAYFYASANRLSGEIPAMEDLPNLTDFEVSGNLLTGVIPDLQSLPNLARFFADGNQLIGGFPQISDLRKLRVIWVTSNLLTGTIPPLAGLPRLVDIHADINLLSGTLPSLADVPHLKVLVVDHNAFTGPPPATYSPKSLAWGASRLCPNFLDPVDSGIWDRATATTPWYRDCMSPSLLDQLH